MIRTTLSRAYYALAILICLTPHSVWAKPVIVSQIESSDPQAGSSKVIQGRQAQPAASSSGIQIQPGTCSEHDQAILETAILDASYLAGAGLNAAAKFADVPFSYFFKNTSTTSDTVSTVYRNIQLLQQGSGPSILATCTDTRYFCQLKEGTAAYVEQNDNGQNQPPVIVFCPTAFSVPRNPTPCTQPPGANSLGSLMLHEMSSVYSVSGRAEGEGDIVDISGETARDVNNALVHKNTDTTADAHAYALLGSFAWDLGLGGAPWNQQTTCPNNFDKEGQFDLKGFKTFADSGYS